MTQLVRLLARGTLRLQNSPFLRQKSKIAPLFPFPVSPGRATPSSPRSPFSRPRAKTRLQTPLIVPVGLFAKVGAALQSKIILLYSRKLIPGRLGHSQEVSENEFQHCGRQVAFKRKKEHLTVNSRLLLDFTSLETARRESDSVTVQILSVGHSDTTSAISLFTCMTEKTTTITALP